LWVGVWNLLIFLSFMLLLTHFVWRIKMNIIIMKNFSFLVFFGFCTSMCVKFQLLPIFVVNRWLFWLILALLPCIVFVYQEGYKMNSVWKHAVGEMRNNKCVDKDWLRASVYSSFDVENRIFVRVCFPCRVEETTRLWHIIWNAH